MILGIRNNARHCWGLAIFASFLVLAVGAFSAIAGESKRILILPFHVTPTKDDKELRSFALHVNKRIRSVVGQLDGGIVVDDEE